MTANTIKSWADHCSSDEDSDGEQRIAPPPSGLPGTTLGLSRQQQQQQEDYEEEVQEDQGSSGRPPPQASSSSSCSRREFVLPSSPPYSAYVGNINYDIRDSDALAVEVDRLLKRRQCRVGNTEEKEGSSVGSSDGSSIVAVRKARLVKNKESGKSSGYGYVQFDTPQQLLAFLHLEEPELCGRNIVVDVASGDRGGQGGGRRPRRSSSRVTDYGSIGNVGSIDGSQFMGGKYSRSNSSGGGLQRSASQGTNQGTNHGNSFQRSVSHGSSGPLRKPSTKSSGEPVLRQRPSLKLAPRSTKPILDSILDSSSLQNKSSIFGAGKPRDEANYAERKYSSITADATSNIAPNALSSSITPPTDKQQQQQQQQQQHSDRDDTSSTNTTPSITSSSSKTPHSPKRTYNYERKNSKINEARNHANASAAASSTVTTTNNTTTNKNRDNHRDGKHYRKENQRKKGGGRMNHGNHKNVNQNYNSNNDSNNSNYGNNNNKNHLNHHHNNNNNNNNSKNNNNNNRKSNNVNNSNNDNNKSENINMLKNKQSKTIPKKANSFSVFMDDSEEDD